MGQTNANNAGTGTKPPEKLLLKDERVLLWGYLAEKCPVCGIHQPFEIYAFDPSFFETEPTDILAWSVRPLAALGGCPLYEPQSNPEAHYLHVCAFCGHPERSETLPEIQVDVFWEPVDRFKALAETTATDRSWLAEKRQVSFSAATRFFITVRRDNFLLKNGLTSLGTFSLAGLVLVSVYFGMGAVMSLVRKLKPSTLAGLGSAATVLGTLLIYWFIKWRYRHSRVAFLMIRLYPFSLELPVLLKHAREDSNSRSIAKALKPLVDALGETERTAA